MPQGSPYDREDRRIIPPKPQVEVDEELAFHLEQRIADYVARGMDPAAARAAALERLGELTEVRRVCTDLLTEERKASRRRMWLDDLAQDLTFGLRAARRAPLFSLLTVLTLALGIGANAAVFGVVKSVLLDGLPYRDADALIRVYTFNKEKPLEKTPLSPGAALDIEKRARSFTEVAWFRAPNDQTYEGPDGAQSLPVAAVSSRFFATLGVRATVGRTIVDADFVPNAPAVALLGYDAWQRLFGGDRAALGKVVRLEGKPLTVIGVLQKGFVGPTGPADFWTPVDLSPFLGNPIGERRLRMLGVVGRLASGVTTQNAERELTTLASDMAREHPESDAAFSLVSLPLRDDMMGDTRSPLLIVMASAGLVLLLTCVNVAGALLSRTLSRRREFAVRTAIGAGRWRLVRQLVTESWLLAVCGGGVGVGIASVGLTLARAFARDALPSYATPALDTGVLMFAFGLALVTGLVFGLAPAISIGRVSTHDVLQAAARGATETRRSRQMRGLLVAGQIALSVSLLAGAGLLTRSLLEMTTTPLGFEPNGVLTVPLRLSFGTYRTREQRAQFIDRLEQQLKSTPGIANVAAASSLPPSQRGRSQFVVENTTWPPGVEPVVLPVAITDDYFSAMRIPVRAGRTFVRGDRNDSAAVAVISESMARKYWPDGNALGARIRVGLNRNEPWRVIVGIVGDVRSDPALHDLEPTIYTNDVGTGSVIIRAGCAPNVDTCDPTPLTPTIRRIVAQLDPSVPTDHITTLRGQVSGGLASERLPVALMVAFGALALVLASVGVYAMFAAMAVAREREFAVRMALGSSRSAVAGLVIRQAALWMTVGLAAGAIGVFGVIRSVRSMLFSVSPFDSIALGGAVVLLVVFGAVALIVPIRRAATVDPISSLR
jgi:predicted permease